MHVQPYLFFEGRCEEALEFYKKALGAEVGMIMRYKESPEPHQPGMVGPGMENKIMHAQFKVGQTSVMASDGHATGEQHFKGFALSILVDTVEQADKLFAGLSDGGKVQMPLTKTFFSPRFGMVVDRFGVHWMIYKPQ